MAIQMFLMAVAILTVGFVFNLYKYLLVLYACFIAMDILNILIFTVTKI